MYILEKLEFSMVKGMDSPIKNASLCKKTARYLQLYNLAIISRPRNLLIVWIFIFIFKFCDFLSSSGCLMFCIHLNHCAVCNQWCQALPHPLSSRPSYMGDFTVHPPLHFIFYFFGLWIPFVLFSLLLFWVLRKKKTKSSKNHTHPLSNSLK